ncbi:transposase [Thiotrichales bacterium 19S11-10]|nr:transposase [Thiotrichales bacterium 19S11-10]MCF6808286.1 transposase [Thiotrichales bacterium 19S9-11]MCF6812302.1 transposase [Thiotrichales bacterium 19S9-12]
MINETYTEEFKREAVKLALESDQSKLQIATNLGVKYSTLMSWLYKSMKKSPKNEVSTSHKSRYQELLNENQKLKKELKQAKLEREILKKAAAYFANQDM